MLGPATVRRVLIVVALVLIGASTAPPLFAQTNDILDFELVSDQRHEATRDGFVVRAENNDSWGWEVGVYRPHTDDNLLYPQRNWHGAFPCQINPRVFVSKVFPDERVIPVRGTRHVVVLQLTGVAVDNESEPTRFTSGHARLLWRPNAERQRPNKLGPADAAKAPRG